MSLPGGEEVPYRSPIIVEDASDDTTRDEEEFSTLVSVRDDFQTDLEGLYKDFNAFDPKGDMPDVKAVEILRGDIRAKREAYKILEPLFVRLNSAVNDVENQRKGK